MSDCVPVGEEHTRRRECLQVGISDSGAVVGILKNDDKYVTEGRSPEPP
jgi:hypothetical protein